MSPLSRSWWERDSEDIHVETSRLPTKKKMTMEKTKLATTLNNYNISDQKITNDSDPTSITSLSMHLPSNYSSLTNFQDGLSWACWHTMPGLPCWQQISSLGTRVHDTLASGGYGPTILMKIVGDRISIDPIILIKTCQHKIF